LFGTGLIANFTSAPRRSEKLYVSRHFTCMALQLTCPTCICLREMSLLSPSVSFSSALATAAQTIGCCLRRSLSPTYTRCPSCWPLAHASPSPAARPHTLVFLPSAAHSLLKPSQSIFFSLNKQKDVAKYEYFIQLSTSINVVRYSLHQGFPNAYTWRAAPNIKLALYVHVFTDGSLAVCQSLLQKMRSLHLTKSAGSN
jgi:hypothetical protein